MSADIFCFPLAENFLYPNPQNRITDILYLDFEKEQVVLSFIVEHTNATGREEDVKNKLREQLEKVFNSVSVLEKISFIQLQEIDIQKIDRKRTENLNLAPDSTLHLLDFQIMLEHAGQIRYNVSLEESIIKGLEFTARVFQPFFLKIV